MAGKRHFVLFAENRDLRPQRRNYFHFPRLNRFSQIHFLLLIPALISLILFAGCKQAEKTAPATPPEVQVSVVEQKDVPIYGEWIGTLDGLVNAKIRAQVSGYLLAQVYKEGATVKKGDLLFEIDPRPFQAALDQAKGQLAQAEAQQGKTELDVKRYAPLVKENAISQEEFDNATQANLAAKAVVASAKAAVEQAELNLSFTKITSPVDGIAGIATAQIGDLVGPTTGELTTVSTVDPIKVYFTVTEAAYMDYTSRFTDVSKRAEHERDLELELILANGSTYPQRGKFYFADRQVDVRTGALRLAGLFPNPAQLLRPGQFARVRAQTQMRPGALLVPQRAVTELQGGYQVSVVDESNHVVIQPVKTGQRIGSQWIIEDGLKPGDKVVVEGLQKANKNGVVVNPKMYAPEQQAAKPAISAKAETSK